MVFMVQQHNINMLLSEFHYCLYRDLYEAYKAWALYGQLSLTNMLHYARVMYLCYISNVQKHSALIVICRMLYKTWSRYR